MALVYIGTSGYSYSDWVGPFYPPGTQKNEFFDHYLNEFNFTELNFSYYKQPDPGIIKKLASKTGDGFLFAIKAHKSLTHEIADSVEEDLSVYRKGIAPLVDAGKLGAVLFQFPFSFHYTPANRRYLDFLCSSIDGIKGVFEFRNSEWEKPAVFDGLERRSMGTVLVDEPDLPGLLKPGERTTSDTAYIRFHGRNKKNWWNGTNVTRYDYLYEKSELAEWLPRIMAILEKVKILLVAFNNHYKAQAVQNARLLKEMLESSGVKDIR
ncbi:MAG: DUF72 domain-containing protein [Spirochaetales bacterium]|nr:DUF72 domain-containing protein [Spirochaetales bacterium]